VRIDGDVIEDAQRVFKVGFIGVLAVGKRNFARVRLVTA
jgi:tyrosyl-tRNA synthetase